MPENLPIVVVGVAAFALLIWTLAWLYRWRDRR